MAPPANQAPGPASRLANELCLDGSPYSVWYADRHSDDLILMLDGGGACWSSLCSTISFVPDVISDWAGFTAFPVPQP